MMVVVDEDDRLRWRVWVFCFDRWIGGILSPMSEETDFYEGGRVEVWIFLAFCFPLLAGWVMMTMMTKHFTTKTTTTTTTTGYEFLFFFRGEGQIA